jgi:hypothetical protein
VGIWAGPFVTVAALLAVGGWLKLRRPAPTARALRAAGLGVLAPLARLLGAAEFAVGVGALVSSNRLLAAVVAGFYAGFAAFVLLALARGAHDTGCGCFGEDEGRPTVIHVALNAGAAAVAAAVAGGSGGGLAAAVRQQPLGGVALLLASAVCTALAYAVMTVLPRTSRVMVHQ